MASRFAAEWPARSWDFSLWSRYRTVRLRRSIATRRTTTRPQIRSRSFPIFVEEKRRATRPGFAAIDVWKTAFRLGKEATGIQQRDVMIAPHGFLRRTTGILVRRMASGTSVGGMIATLFGMVFALTGTFAGWHQAGILSIAGRFALCGAAAGALIGLIWGAIEAFSWLAERRADPDRAVCTTPSCEDARNPDGRATSK